MRTRHPDGVQPRALLGGVAAPDAGLAGCAAPLLDGENRTAPASVPDLSGAAKTVWYHGLPLAPVGVLEPETTANAAAIRPW